MAESALVEEEVAYLRAEEAVESAQTAIATIDDGGDRDLRRAETDDASASANV